MKKDYIEQRVLEVANYIVESGDTVRGAAKKFGVCKSTIHKDVVDRLPEISTDLAKRTREVLDLNLAERHIRGGLQTQLKYKS